ncbi:MAG TPA: TlpA disulfide reductase family protein [Streptosporangiaceae bacterium]
MTDGGATNDSAAGGSAAGGSAASDSATGDSAASDSAAGGRVTNRETARPRAGRRTGRPRVLMAASLLAAAAILSALTVLAIRWTTSSHASAAAKSGLGFFRLDRPAPALRLPNLRGAGTSDLTSLAGKPIVLNFWSSSCPPCKKETPALASVARTLGGKVSFLGIDSADLRKSASAFVAKYKVPYPIAFDQGAAATSAYGVVALPVTFFLSPSGKTILGENVGPLTSGRLRVILSELYHVT